MEYKLFDYQEKCVDECMKFIESYDMSPGIVLAPTSWGKSIAISEISRRLGGGVLVLHLSQELLSQNLEKLEALGGYATIYSAALDSKEISTTTFATLKSVKQAVSQLKAAGIKYVIIDECDRNFSPKKDSEFMKFITALKPQSVIGFTATPWALTATPNGAELTMLPKLRPSFFKKFIHVTQIQDLIKRGRWSPCEYEVYDYDRSMLTLNTNLSDYTQESIEQANKVQGVNRNIAVRLKSLLAEGFSRILVFVDATDNCKTFSDWLPDSASLLATTSAKERKRIVREFKEGKIKVLFNYGVLSVGFDYPELEVIILGRPTNSLSWLYQVFGRGVRIHENKKSFKFIDMGGNIQKFGKIENLEIRALECAGHTVVSGNKVLTGIPMGTSYTVDEYIQLVKYGPKKEVIDHSIRFWFGKYENKPLMQIPVHYLKWWATKEPEEMRTAQERRLAEEITKVIRQRMKFR